VEPGLRERKKRETRLALSLAAVRLVAERGWDNVTVEDIAAAANVSDRTFRNYFDSKAHAIASRHLDRTLQVVDELRARPADEPLWDAVAHAMTVHYGPPAGGRRRGSPGGHGGDPDAIRRALADPAVQGEILKANVVAQAELAKVVAERTGTDADRDLYPTLAAAAINAATGVAIQHAMTTRASLAGTLREVFHQIARGLPPPR
jgi:AcrR family transcriptional regulator